MRLEIMSKTQTTLTQLKEKRQKSTAKELLSFQESKQSFMITNLSNTTCR